MRLSALPILALFAAAAATPARADFSGPLSMGAFEATMGTGPIAQTLNQQVRPQRQPRAAPPPHARTVPLPSQASLAAPTAADLRALRFTPSPARRRATFDAWLAQNRHNDPAAADQYAKIFAERDLVTQIEAPLAQMGLRVDDMADAYAMWLIVLWSASQGHNREPDKAAVAAVRGQVARALVSTGTAKGFDEAGKQKFTETLLIQSSMIDAAIDHSQNQPEAMAQLRQMALQNGQAMGLDLASLQLTRDGLAPAR